MSGLRQSDGPVRTMTGYAVPDAGPSTARLLDTTDEGKRERWTYRGRNFTLKRTTFGRTCGHSGGIALYERGWSAFTHDRLLRKVTRSIDRELASEARREWERTTDARGMSTGVGGRGRREDAGGQQITSPLASHAYGSGKIAKRQTCEA